MEKKWLVIIDVILLICVIIFYIGIIYFILIIKVFKELNKEKFN